MGGINVKETSPNLNEKVISFYLVGKFISMQLGRQIRKLTSCQKTKNKTRLTEVIEQ